ncbi:TfoX/Sxy family protein [Candidatus Leptofilum sp.]|uniref:TfoX/Sxy family protein n=1 Tax=Candidatus Leptofilum sp. TaxID=3241576 RepID=UPI003B59BF36
MSKKQTKPAYETGETLVSTLSVLGDVNGRKMFGGVGIFVEDAMFALVSSDNVIHFKVDDSNRAKYEAAGAAQFHNMPYYKLPDAIFQNDDDLFAWAKESMAIARASKKKKK